MSVTSISGTDPNQGLDPQNGAGKKIRDDFQQLQQALSSGDLDQAKQAFSTLQSDLPGGATSSNSPLGKALGAIGDALNSGDVNGAQQAFAALQQQQRQGGVGGHHHHHHHKASGTDGSTSSSSTSTSTDSTTTTSVGSLVNQIA